MKKISLLFLLSFMTGFFLLFNYVTAVFAHSRPAVENHIQPTYRLNELEKFDLISTQAYTLYFPIISLSYPPPNPKKGIGISGGYGCTDMATLNAAWHFNWGIYPDQTCDSLNPGFVPRLYNAASVQSLSQAIVSAQPSGWLIGFSEPNLPWHGNMTPQRGAELWWQIEAAADTAGIKLVSPSPNQWAPGQNGLPYGHQWVWAMVDAFEQKYGRKPRFDALGWNIYAYDPNSAIAYLTARRNEALARGYTQPFWILEYAGECWRNSNNGNENIMLQVTAWFNQTPWIERYAWFANRITGPDSDGVYYTSCSLINPNTGNLTLLGSAY